MDNRDDIRDFLATRRARLTPEQVGLPAGGGRRRVPGLRREEVAVLAGVSTEWYTRLEKGHIAGVSEDVLEAVARALRLDEAEHTYLFDLARAARTMRRPPRRRKADDLPAPVQWMLDSMVDSAAFVANGRLDLVASNALGRALYSPVIDFDPVRPNIARYQFLDPTADTYFTDLAGAAKVTVALLRTEAGRHPDDKELRGLVGELSTVSETFRTRWASHDVRLHHAGHKQFNHPAVGLIDLAYHSMDIAPGSPRPLTMTVYTAEPGSASDEQMRLLASWAATEAPEHVRADQTS
ncbi:helix-turn-helix transcriptional regulator [Aeromicrobium sp. IC_218]|uniref:helix-turn-helix transcriptional regulator n=1 Tax=Aeromicrobium sp. IC_218 TaxID=2545468 RepID=UPI00103B525F|nr:helix-turn-helix transcriptional regulator [Aeromicrobium sp. IC_218]TCI99612.1 XRE family transcriptional regulator [Aeromicrobium sp. IC_218]